MPPLPIRNIIFDLGNVLIHCDLDFAAASLASKSDRPIEEIRHTLDENEIINQFDEGIHSGEAFNEEMRKLTGWQGTPAELEAIWQQMLHGDEQMFEYLEALIERGLRAYILSNANPYHVEYVKSTWPQIMTTHGQIFSCECRMIKPNEAIFLHTRDTFRISPEESVFIDDRIPNIRAAERIGFLGIVHRSYEDTLRKLEELLKH